MRFSKVFGIGLPRTGTTSLNIALNTIGISSIHFPFSLYESKDFTILNQYVGFVDSPIPYLYQQLDCLYPGSGFVLTTRPINQWLSSIKWLLEEGSSIWEWKSSYDSYHKDFFGSASFNLDLYQRKYHEFHSEVVHYFQERDNLLILDLKIGYGYPELCAFLNVPTHNGKYPHGNEMRSSRKLQKFAYHVGKYNYPCGLLLRKLDYYSIRLRSLL
jgi:hypothetical protein